ncbi:MAG TPA: hypothetical protein P5181_08670 [Dermatophilaceae bacterium]|nr:hypothetical protein [Dermatophilaceae bacterium]
MTDHVNVGIDPADSAADRFESESHDQQWLDWCAEAGQVALPHLLKLHEDIPRTTAAMLCTADGFNLCALGIDAAAVGQLAALTSSLYAVSSAAVRPGRGAPADLDYVTLATGDTLRVVSALDHARLGRLILWANATQVPLGMLLIGVRGAAARIAAEFDGLEGPPAAPAAPAVAAADEADQSEAPADDEAVVETEQEPAAEADSQAEAWTDPEAGAEPEGEVDAEHADEPTGEDDDLEPTDDQNDEPAVDEPVDDEATLDEPMHDEATDDEQAEATHDEPTYDEPSEDLVDEQPGPRLEPEDVDGYEPGSGRDDDDDDSPYRRLEPPTRPGSGEED